MSFLRGPENSGTLKERHPQIGVFRDPNSAAGMSNVQLVIVAKLGNLQIPCVEYANAELNPGLIELPQNRHPG